jgi:hypothetical protein
MEAPQSAAEKQLSCADWHVKGESPQPMLDDAQ